MVAAGVQARLQNRRVEHARRALRPPHPERAQRCAQHRRGPPRVRVRVGVQAAVHHERGRDRRRGHGPVQLAAEQLEQRQRGVVERDDDGAAHAVVPPQRLDQVRALDCRVPVVPGLI